MKVSIIIPTYNAEEFIEKCLESIRKACQESEIIIADGGSSDRTLPLLQGKDVIVVSSSKGRGIQLNKGAKSASGDILFFLHADTIVPEDILDVIREFFNNKRVNVAKCRLKFDQSSRILSFYEQLARVDSFWTSFGDQGIVVQKDFFQKIGGFPDEPLLEDVIFFRKARMKDRVYTMPVQVITSAERFARNGLIKQQCFNALIILKYLFGVPINQLAAEYQNFPRKL